jgi:hypothetical protein
MLSRLLLRGVPKPPHEIRLIMLGADSGEIGRNRGAGRADRVAAIAALVPKDLSAVCHAGSTIGLSASSHQNGSQRQEPACAKDGNHAAAPPKVIA